MILRFIAAFAFVLALMGLLSIVMKRLGFGHAVNLKRQDRRLKMIEHLALDGKNRLVMVQRDNVQHLLLIGNEHALIVEKDIAPRPSSYSEQDKNNETS